MKYWEITLAILVALYASFALADDFKTTDGKEYKNAKINRVEPDGVVISFSGGIVKIPFTELSKELQRKYSYDPEAAKQFAADVGQKQQALYTEIQSQKEEANARASEVAAKSAAEHEQKQAIIREQAAQEAQNAQRAASVKAAIQHGGIIPGMTMDECIQASGKPQIVKRTTDTQGHPVEEWFYGRSCLFRGWCCNQDRERDRRTRPASSIAALNDFVKYWELIADHLSKAGWSWGCVATVDSNGRTIFVADAHRDDG